MNSSNCDPNTGAPVNVDDGDPDCDDATRTKNRRTNNTNNCDDCWDPVLDNDYCMNFWSSICCFWNKNNDCGGCCDGNCCDGLNCDCDLNCDDC